MRCPTPAATAAADHPADHDVAREPGLGRGSGVGAAIMGGDDFKILMPRAAVPVLVLDAGIRETDVAIVVRQLILPRPAPDLGGFAIRPAVAVLLPSIASCRNC